MSNLFQTVENVEINVSPLDVSLIEFDEIDPRELSIKTLEGIVHNDPLELNGICVSFFHV